MHRLLVHTLLILLTLSAAACTAARTAPPPTDLVQDQWASNFPAACVAADHPVASRAGALMLLRGGNAIDAAVAASFALSVVRPYSCGIGGGGFMVIRLAPDADAPLGPLGRDVALNYRETTPAGIDALFFERQADPTASSRGGAAVAIPGTVAGLLDALDRFGSLDRRAVLEPAIAAAREGFHVDAHFIQAARTLTTRFRENPEYQTRFAFVWDRFLKHGDIHLGDLIVNPEQATALELIARDGADAFYRGPIAQAIIDAVRDDHQFGGVGVMTTADLASYTVADATPLRFRAFGHVFLTMPPPSSGGIAMAQTLGILERTLQPGMSDADRVHLLAESLKHAFADRAEYLADPAFSPVPIDVLIHPSYLADLASRIDLGHTSPPDTYGSRHGAPPPPTDHGTSHISAVDRFGNAVACTETINLEFGSLLAVPRYGFCLNNEMDDFLTTRGKSNAFGLTQSDRNLPAPGKRPLSSMSPTIVLLPADVDGREGVLAVAGASGGPRIITATIQTLLAVVTHHADAGAAVEAPRFHHQWQPDTLYYERSFGAQPNAAAIASMLRLRGHVLTPDPSAASVQLIKRSATSPGWQAASDPRKGGVPAGY